MECVLLVVSSGPLIHSSKGRPVSISVAIGAFALTGNFSSVNSKVFLVQIPWFYVKRIQVNKGTVGGFDHPGKLFTNQTEKIDRFDYIKRILYNHTKTKNNNKKTHNHKTKLKGQQWNVK